MAVSTRKKDPLAGFRFKVLIENYNPIGFMEVSGIKGETANIQYREGDDEPVFRQIPGLTTYDPIQLKRGLDPDGTLQQIRNSVVLPGGSKSGEGASDPGYRFNGVIYLLDKGRSVIKRWRFVNGWAKAYMVEGFNATSDEISVETLEIIHEGVTLVGSSVKPSPLSR